MHRVILINYVAEKLFISFTLNIIVIFCNKYFTELFPLLEYLVPIFTVSITL